MFHHLAGPRPQKRASEPMRLALFEPDIPQNTGALLRIGACLGVGVDIIEPCGFPLSDAGLKRAGMDYVDRATMTRHSSWARFLDRAQSEGRRIVLLTTRGATAHHTFRFAANDILLLGRESAGVPEAVHARADARVRVPMAEGARSLNVAVAGAMVLGEALRQLAAWPEAMEEDAT